MKNNKAKQRMASLLALLVCLSAPMQCGAALAEDIVESQPAPVAPAPESAPAAPEAEAPAQSTQPESTPAVEAAPDPSEAPIITPEPEEPADSDETPAPEETPDAGEIEETPAPEEEQILRNPYSTWYGVTPSNEQGMSIPILYQTDYPEVICTIRGIERSVQSSGCGATCISMVIAYLTGNTEQNPYIIFCDAVDKGLYTGEGFTHGMISHYAEEYGVNNRWIGKDGDVIIAALEKGIPIIAHMGPGIFTDRGHYVVLRGLTHDGKILLNDPVSPTKTGKAFPLKTILTQCKSSNPFMLCWTDEMEEEVGLLDHLHDKQMSMEQIAIEIKRPIPNLPQAVEVTTSMVNLRVSPGTGDVATHLNLGDKVLAVEERVMKSGSFWYGVNYNGRTLYLKSEYIKPIDVTEEELAILQERVIQPTAEPEIDPELVIEAEQVDISEPTVEPEPEVTPEPTVESEPENTPEPAIEPETIEELVIEAESEVTPEPTIEPEPEVTPEPTAEPEPETTPAPETASGFAPCAAEVTADRVNLRVSPGTGEAAKVLRQGAKLYINERRFTHSGAAWYGVIFEGEQLYVKGEYIRFVEADAAELDALKETSMQPEATEAPEETVAAVQQPVEEAAPQAVPLTLNRTMDGEFDGAYIAYIGCDSANLRDHIGTRDGLVIYSVPNGTAMYIIGEELCYEDGYVWCKVLFRGQQLYVRGDLLTI